MFTDQTPAIVSSRDAASDGDLLASRDISERIAASQLHRWSIPLAWGSLFALFLGARIYHLDHTPAHNDTTDEYAWTWSGMTLIETGKPRAWSNLPAYESRRQIVDWRGHQYKMVEPWLDHPPLYSLYAGGWQLALGKREIFDVDLQQMRWGSLPLAAVSFMLLSLILWRLLSPLEVLLALLFYSVLPLIVLQQRLVVSENLIVPLSLGVVYLVLRQRDRFSWGRAAGVLFLCTLLPLAKVAALSASVFLTMWALISGSGRARWITTGAVALGTFLGIGAYLGYGHHIDGNLFSAVLTNHHDRFKGFLGMEVLLFEPKLVSRPTADLLCVLGCALALASLSNPRLAPWGLAVLVYAACMAFFVDQHRVFGWYYLPLYPWLCAALAVTIVQASRQRILGLSLLWCTAAWLTIAEILYERKVFEADSLRFEYLGGLLVLYGAWSAWPRLARATLPAVNGILVAATAFACLFEVYSR